MTPEEFGKYMKSIKEHNESFPKERMLTMSIEECEQIIKEHIDNGWIMDVNDEKRLGFIKPVDEKTEWFRDYHKEKRTIICGNGKQMINLQAPKNSTV